MYCFDGIQFYLGVTEALSPSYTLVRSPLVVRLALISTAAHEIRRPLHHVTSRTAKDPAEANSSRVRL